MDDKHRIEFYIRIDRETQERYFCAGFYEPGRDTPTIENRNQEDIKYLVDRDVGRIYEKEWREIEVVARTPRHWGSDISELPTDEEFIEFKKLLEARLI